jgi:hypothetical protein
LLKQGANIIIHHANSPQVAMEAAEEVLAVGRKAWIIQGDFPAPNQAHPVISKAIETDSLYAVVNNASIF